MLSKTSFSRFNKTVQDRFLFNPLHGALVAIAAALILAVAACHPKPKPESAEPPPVPVARGPQDEPSKKIPPDLYARMPLYPGAAVEHVRKPKGAMREILFITDAQMPELVAFFKDGLAKNEFRVTSALIMPARRTWSCDFHKDGRPGTIMLYPADNDKSKMTIDLIYEMPQKADEALQEPQEDFDVVGPGEIAPQTQNPNLKAKRD